MNKLASADALIIDLRKNGGGSADMVALLVSYLLEPDADSREHIRGRDGRVTDETWTTKDLPGRRFLGKDVYLLTSGFTFSGGGGVRLRSEEPEARDARRRDDRRRREPDRDVPDRRTL